MGKARGVWLGVADRAAPGSSTVADRGPGRPGCDPAAAVDHWGDAALVEVPSLTTSPNLSSEAPEPDTTAPIAAWTAAPRPSLRSLSLVPWVLLPKRPGQARQYGADWERGRSELAPTPRPAPECRACPGLLGPPQGGQEDPRAERDTRDRDRSSWRSPCRLRHQVALALRNDVVAADGVLIEEVGEPVQGHEPDALSPASPSASILTG